VGKTLIHHPWVLPVSTFLRSARVQVISLLVTRKVSIEPQFAECVSKQTSNFPMFSSLRENFWRLHYTNLQTVSKYQVWKSHFSHHLQRLTINKSELFCENKRDNTFFANFHFFMVLLSIQWRNNFMPSFFYCVHPVLNSRRTNYRKNVQRIAICLLLTKLIKNRFMYFFSFGCTTQFRPWPPPWNFPFRFSY
jgi:hypothetical protein